MAMNKKQGCVITTVFTTDNDQAAIDVKAKIAALVQDMIDYRIDFRLIECKDGIAERKLGDS